MKNYEKPYFEQIATADADVITASGGTETTPMPDNGMIWDLDIQ